MRIDLSGRCRSLPQTCPEKIEGDPDKFCELMVDLHRGLLIKLFVEVSDCQRCWHPAEAEVARELLNHVWGADLDRDQLPDVLHNVAELDKTLTWESVLGPFVRIPALAEQAAELNTCVMRIANLIVKADSHVLPTEAARLRSLQATLEKILRVSDPGAGTAAPRVAQAGQQVAQRLPPRPQDQCRTESGRPATADSAKKSSEPQKSPHELFNEAADELNHLIGLKEIKARDQEPGEFPEGAKGAANTRVAADRDQSAHAVLGQSGDGQDDCRPHPRGGFSRGSAF